MKWEPRAREPGSQEVEPQAVFDSFWLQRHLLWKFGSYGQNGHWPGYPPQFTTAMLRLVLLHSYCYTHPVTLVLLLSSCYTPTVTLLLYYSSCYTGPVTLVMLHSSSYTYNVTLFKLLHSLNFYTL